MLIILVFLFSVPWISVSKIKISPECPKFCKRAADEMTTLRAENAILRFLVNKKHSEIQKPEPWQDATVYDLKVRLTLHELLWYFLMLGQGTWVCRDFGHCNALLFLIWLAKAECEKPTLVHRHPICVNRLACRSLLRFQCSQCHFPGFGPRCRNLLCFQFRIILGEKHSALE